MCASSGFSSSYVPGCDYGRSIIPQGGHKRAAKPKQCKPSRGGRALLGEILSNSISPLKGRRHSIIIQISTLNSQILISTYYSPLKTKEQKTNTQAKLSFLEKWLIPGMRQKNLKVSSVLFVCQKVQKRSGTVGDISKGQRSQLKRDPIN